MKSMIVDVREPYEYIRGHVPGAVNIPSSEFLLGRSRLTDLPKDTQLVVYCVSGTRSGEVIRVLKHAGFINVVNGINRQQVEAALAQHQL
jgi:rhodanese-related sulfurtransferase